MSTKADTTPGRGRRALLMVSAAVSASLMMMGCGRLDRDAVLTELDSVRSAAAEGALVAGQVERARTFRSFTVIHTAELHKVAMNVADDLQQSQAETGLAHGASDGAEVAESVARELEKLHEHPTDRHVATSVRKQLASLASKADQTGEEL